jgi:hypothetical protein
MTDTNEPVIAGTPDQWWERAEQITEAEAADRDLGSWYIGRENSGYRISTSTVSANESRKGVLRTYVDQGSLSADAISPKVRKLIRVDVEPPEWLHAPLLIADLEVGADQRVAWRRTKHRWQLLTDPRIAVNELTMTQLNPRIAEIVEVV